MAATPAELLQKAKDRLIEKGWTRHDWGGDAGPNCTLGALIAEYGLLQPVTWDAPLYRNRFRAEHYLGEAVDNQGYSGRTITSWNDECARDFNDVMALFDEALALAKEDDRG